MISRVLVLFERILVEKMGLEPTTFWLPAKRSSQLSYIPVLRAQIYDFIKTKNNSKPFFLRFVINLPKITIICLPKTQTDL